jgi:ATP-dependent Clp protease ATP-binding subunit ClpC
VFERFTDRARRVVVLAQRQAVQLQHEEIASEHFLLALIDEGTGIGAQALRSFVPLGTVRGKVMTELPPGRRPLPGQVPFSKDGKAILERSLRVALRLKHNYIGTEHIFLALLEDDSGLAGRVLTGLGIDEPAARARVTDLLTGQASPPDVSDLHRLRGEEDRNE